MEFAESGCPIFRATNPLSRGQLKSKGHGKLSVHYAADLETIETIFRIIVSAYQLSLHGAIAEICDEYESLHERTGRPVVMGQSSSSLVLSVINTKVLLDCDDPANQDLLLQQYGERIEKLSQQDRDHLDNVDFIPSNVHSSRQEALLYIFEDSEPVIKMIIMGRSPTMRHVSRTHRVALDWLLDRINLDPKIQIKYIDTKNQLADILTKGNFTRDEWNHLLCLFNISQFSSTKYSEVMSKRKQKDTDEERVTAKSKPMMNLDSRCNVRDPYVLSSTASQSPVKTRYESQLPLSSWTEQHLRTGRPVKDAYSSSHSERNADKNWSSQEWKSDELTEVRTGRPVNEQPLGLFIQHTDRFIVDDDDMDSDTEAESDMSLLSRSFLHRVSDRVRKIQDQSSKDATQDSINHSLIWGMFVSSTLEASVFMGKNYSENLQSIKNTGKDLTMKLMFDISEKLITDQSDEIYGVNTINWDDSSWKHLSSIGDEDVISLSHAKVYVFSDSVFCLGKMNENPDSNTVWEDKLTWFKSSSQYRALDTIDGESMEFEWNISQDLHIAALQQSPRVPVKNERRARRIHRTDHLHVDVQRHLMGI